MIYNGKEYEVVSKHNGYTVLRSGAEVICAASSDLEEKKEKKTVSKKKKETVND